MGMFYFLVLLKDIQLVSKTLRPCQLATQGDSYNQL